MGKKMIRIAPSLLACDFKNLDKEMKRVIKSKADWIHLDIMDGNFVNNISLNLVEHCSLNSFLKFLFWKFLLVSFFV